MKIEDFYVKCPVCNMSRPVVAKLRKDMHYEVPVICEDGKYLYRDMDALDYDGLFQYICGYCGTTIAEDMGTLRCMCEPEATKEGKNGGD